MAAAETRRSLAGHSPPGSPGSGRARRQRAAQRRPRAHPPGRPPARCPACSLSPGYRGRHPAKETRRDPVPPGTPHRWRCTPWRRAAGTAPAPALGPAARARAGGACSEPAVGAACWLPAEGAEGKGAVPSRAEPTWPWPYWAAVACRPGSLSHGNRSGTQPPVLGGIPRSSPAAGPAGLRRAVLRWGVSSLRAGGSGSLLKCGYVSG